MKTFRNLGKDEIDEVVDFILNSKPNIILLFGQVGAGKTTLISHLVHQMGSNSEVSSPTFALLNEYETEQGMVYHSDWYRLKSIDELYDAGIMEYFNLPGLFIIEWPELGLSQIPKPHLKIEIQHAQDTRTYSISEIHA